MGLPVSEATSTSGGLLLAAAVLLPFAGMLFGMPAGGRHTQRIAFGVMPLGLAGAVGIAMTRPDGRSPGV